MNVKIEMGPGSAIAKVALAPNETFTAEGGSMVAMSGNMSIETTTHKKGKGSIASGLKRMFSGEGFFMNHYTASANGGEVILSSSLPGDMMVKELQNEKLVVQGGSYVASSTGVDIDFEWQGMKSVFSGESIFWLGVRGTGSVVLNSFGAIYPIEVDGEYVVDTGHIVAFTENLSFTISKAGKSILSSFLGGEGLVCKFKGTGTVWCQSHNPQGFGQAVGPKLKPRS